MKQEPVLELHIICKHDSYGVREFRTTKRQLAIGRCLLDDEAGLDLDPDVEVSHRHARVTFDEGLIWIEDLNSTNGTWVDQNRIERKTQLTCNVPLRIGQTVLSFSTNLVHPDTAPPESLTAFNGTLTDHLNAIQPVSSLLLTGASASETEKLKNHLSIFYDLGEALASATALDDCLRRVLKALMKGISSAERASILLLENSDLLLKAHEPEGAPSVSLQLAHLAMNRRQAFIWRLDAQQSPPFKSPSLVRNETQSAMYAPLIHDDRILGVVNLENLTTAAAFDEYDLRLLTAMASHSALFIQSHLLKAALNAEANLRSNMMRWFSPKIANRLLDHKRGAWLGGERVQATILYSDVRGFTAISSKMEPNQVVSVLNQTFQTLIPIIFEHDGSIDKFVGDAIVAVFGSPEPDNLQWEHAVRAAVAMQKAMGELSNAKSKLPKFEIGIGISSGHVVHGFVGSEERMEFTVIGDAVNRASRLCDNARKGEVLIGKDVLERTFNLVSVESRLVATKHSETEGPLQAYLVMGLKV